jgi:hypothetical protein
LDRLGATYVHRRWVEHGRHITAAGVSAGIGMALQLAARLTSEDDARRIQVGLEYDPQPSSGSMRWELADVERYWLGSAPPPSGAQCRHRCWMVIPAWCSG